MTDTEVDRAIDNAKCADQELLIRDENGKVFTENNTNSSTLEDNFENSDLDLASNLSSSTEIDTEEKESLRRSKRLTKTIQFGNNTESTNRSTGGERRQYLDRSNAQIKTLRRITNRNRQNCQEQLTVHQTLDQWRNDRQNRSQNTLIGQSSANSRGGNVEGKQTQTRN